MPSQPTPPTPVRTPNKWGEGDKLRGEILATASTLLSELDGEDALTIRGVARSLGISPASIYQHFSDRAALVDGLVSHEYSRLRAAMAAADLNTPDGDVVGRVYAQAHAYCRFAVDNPGLYRLMGRFGGARAEQSVRVEGPLGDIVRDLAAALRRCEESGRQLRLPSARAAQIVLVAAHGSVLYSMNNPLELRLAAVERHVDETLSLIFAE